MTFLANASLGYGWAKKISALDDAKYSAFRARINNEKLLAALPEARADFDEKKAENEAPSYTDFFLDSDEAVAFGDIGIELTLKRIKGLATSSRDIRNTIYQISVANVGLMQIQKVQVLEDCCTNELQGWLDRGWRILAVCPPNDARRPSYVMGHFEKEPPR